jgi:PAS domain S-box-containing protein
MEEPTLLVNHKDGYEIRGACSMCGHDFHGFIRKGEDEAVLQLKRNFRLHCRQRHGIVVLPEISEDSPESEAIRQKERDAEIAAERILEKLPGPAYVCARGTRRLLAANPEFHRLMGYTSSESKTLRLDDLRPTEDVPILMRALSRNVRAGTAELRYQTKDGRLVHVRANFRDIGPGEQDALVADAVLVVVTDFKMAG